MIVVVEDISAAGKTTWCRRHAAGHLVDEGPPQPDAPDRAADARAAARFWTRRNERRWRLAKEMEARTGLAVCDTDPLKLHYGFCLWRLGGLMLEQWQFERDLARDAIGAARLGFADLYLVNPIDAHRARAQRDADPSRRRRNFDLHVRLGPPLIEWYRGIERVLPGRVIWNLPGDGLPAAEPRKKGDDLALFDALMKTLSAF